MTEEPESPDHHGHLATKAAIALGGVTLLWGTTYVLTQNVVSVMPVSSFLFWRFAIAAVTLALLRPRSIVGLRPRQRFRALVIGLAVSVGFAFQSIGLQHTSASMSGFVTGLFVALTPLVSGLLFRDRISKQVWIGVTVAAVGLALLSLRDWSVGLGEALTLLGALGFATQIALLGRWSTPQVAYGTTAIEVGVVAIVGLVTSGFDGGLRTPDTSGVWLQLAFLGMVASAFAFAVQAWSQSHMAASRSAVIMTGETVWAGFTGILIAGDDVTVRLLIGGALILAAMYLVEVRIPITGGRMRTAPSG